jgi:hypothetical protein
MLSLQGAGIPTANEWVTITQSPTSQTILYWGDYAGPPSTRLGLPRSKHISKGYIAIFFFFFIKAIHIELVTSLSTEAFLAASRRFAARREKPHTIYSDKGTNFQEAAHQLHELHTMLHSPSQMASIQDHLASEGCTWKFITPQAPTKVGYGKLLSSRSYITWDVDWALPLLITKISVLYEIEACLNSHSLCTLSSDPHCSSYLSPGHILIGNPLVQLPTADHTDIKSNRLSRWQAHQQQLQIFWKRWSSDYLHELQQRQLKATPNLQPGQVVLLKGDSTTPLQWPMAHHSHPPRSWWQDQGIDSENSQGGI